MRLFSPPHHCFIMCCRTRATILTIITSVISISGTHAILKQILGAAFISDVIPSPFYNLRCVTSLSNFTSFMLYTRRHPDDPRQLVPNDWNLLQRSEFDSSLPSKVVVHGFIDNQRISDWMIKMKNALLAHDDYNVIITDWSCGNGFPYNQAITNSKITGEKLADLILFLKETRDANPKDFHLIGHSLGSHISAIAGRRVQGIGRITALDPAGPRFYNAPLEDRLDPSDADFVDVIHTDSGTGLFEGLGLGQQLGHVDFYPNGGKTQPGCHTSPFSILSRIGLQRAARYYISCDHFRAIDFYLESLEASKTLGGRCHYVSVQCRDWDAFNEGRCADCTELGNCATMGFPSSMYPFRDPEGGAKSFYVKTSEKEPFCLHQYQVLVETGESVRSPRNTQIDIDIIPTNRGSNVIYLEMTNGAGKVMKLKLNENNEDVFRARKKYMYLATSKYPLGSVQDASLWMGNENKPPSDRIPLNSAFGVILKKIEILPISMPAELLSRSGERERLILCSSRNHTVSSSHAMELNVNEC